MRICHVRTIPLEYPLPQPVFDANSRMARKPALLVEVQIDDGLIGFGQAAHFGGPLTSTQVVIGGELREHLRGEDPREIERLWERMHQRSY
jgi:L-alanine-DL-glutamate epimerase-like enolase superfamily enzyme